MTWCFQTFDSPLENESTIAPLKTGLAVARAVERVCPAVQLKLKWPNDLLGFDEPSFPKKIGGILVEKRSLAKQTYVIVGIGINVNNSIAKTDIRELESHVPIPPASLSQLSPTEVDLTELVIEIVTELEQTFMGAPPDGAWREEYLARLAFRGMPVQVTNNAGERKFTGVLETVTDDGSLVIRGQTGIQKIYSGSIRPL